MNEKKKREKRIISVIMAVIMVLIAIPFNSIQVAAGPDSARVIIGNANSIPGETVELNVVLNNSPNIKSMAVSNIIYDKSKMTLDNVEWLCSAQIQNWNAAQGRGVLTFDQNTNANGPVLKMTFTVFEHVEDADVNVTCTITVMRMDESNNEISVNTEIIPGTISIRNALRGDVDGNEKINSNDAVYLLYHVMFGSSDYPINQNGDMDGNGKVNSNDAVYLLYHIMFGEEEYPLYIKCQHSMTGVEAKPATCTEDGNIAYWYCDKCGEYFSDANASNVIALERTVVKAKGHTVVIDEAVPATYTEKGLTEGSHCSSCGQVIVAQEEYGPLVHDQYSIEYYIYGNDEYLAGVSIQNSNPSTYTSDEGVDWLDDLVVPGYNFEGWFDGQGSAASRVNYIPAGTARNIKLYAKWTKEEYRITFDNSSMNLPTTYMTYTVDQKVPLDKPTVDRYVFLGWTTDKDELVSEIKPGTTGNFTLHSNWTSKRNLAKPVSSLGDPIIVEDTIEGRILFTYEIGQVENVPLYTVKELPSAGGVVSVYTETISKGISTTDASTVAKAIDHITTDSTAWTLSEDWNETTHIEDSVLEEHGYDRTTGEQVGKTSSNTYTLTTNEYDNTVVKANEGTVATTTQYNTNEVNSRETWESKASLSVSDTESAKYTDSAKVSVEVGVGYGPVSAKMGASAETSTEISSSSTAGSSAETTIAHENSSHSKTGTDTVTVEDNTKTTTSDKGWSKSSASSSSSSTSLTKYEEQTLSERIANERKYGQSYAKGGSNSTSADWSTSTGESNQYSTTLTYFNSEETTEGVSYTINGESDGSYRLVRAGIVHVFAVVVYDIANAEYSVSTYAVLDDDTYTYIDYSATSAAKFDDNENGVLPFEIPYFVNDYVNGRIVATEGLFYSELTSSTAEYEGTNTSVVVPEFISVDNHDNTRSAYTIRHLSENTFSGNTAIKSVMLSNYIGEIPDSAFAGCSSLQFVYGSEIRSIGNNAFDGCTSLGEFKVSSTVESIGENAFRGVDSIVVNASSKDVVFGAINSGAKRITINISAIADEMSDITLEVPDSVDYFELQGGRNSFSGLKIKSNAGTTVLNGLTIIDNTGIPLVISSESITLNQVVVESPSYVLLMSGNAPTVRLYGTTKLISSSDKAVVCRNVTLEKISSNLSNKIEVTGDVLSLGTPYGTDYSQFIVFPEHGDVKPLTAEEFEMYIKGCLTVALDANGGVIDQDNIIAYYGSKIGNLPVPERDYYSFAGWFLDDGTTEVTDTYVFVSGDNVTLHAHWTQNPLSGWVKETEVPSGAQVVNTKWAYDYTSGSALGSSSDYTIIGSSTSWSDYGAWSDWSKTSVSNSDSRQVETKTVTDAAAYTKYNYYHWWGVGDNGGIYNSYGNVYWKNYESFSLNYELTKGKVYDSYYQSYTYSVSGKHGNLWWLESTTNVPAVTHTEYRYRDRSLIYHYSLESEINPTGQTGVSNVVQWVQYRMK